MHKKNNSVVDVIQQGFCIGCGACTSTCPKAICSLYEINGSLIPIIDNYRCINCGSCVNVCPIASPYLRKIDAAHSIAGNNYDLIVGSYRSIYLGYSNDYDIRFNGASGGIVTSILIYLLEKKYVDWVITVSPNSDSPLRPKVIITNSIDQIRQAKGSRYCPVPIDLAIKQILNTNATFAIVGLPCHIMAIKLAAMIYPQLNDRLFLTLGLFCGHTPNFNATSFLLKKLKINPNDTLHFDYRGNGWPGYISIETKGNPHPLKVPHSDRLAWGVILNSFLFTNLGCLICCDLTNEYSDISFGDAWLPELLKSDSLGHSLLISRTVKGIKILNEMSDQKIISLRPTELSSILHSQGHAILFKKHYSTTRLTSILVNKNSIYSYFYYSSSHSIKPRRNLIYFMVILLFLKRSMFLDFFLKVASILPTPIFHKINDIFTSLSGM